MSKMILIVDDDAGFCQTLRDILDREGFSVDEARDGKEAHEMIKKDPYTLIFMDINMPSFDGFLTSVLLGRNDPESELVFVTGYTEDEKVKKILEAIPESSWLRKPVDPGEIVRIAKKHREKLQKSQD